MKFKLTEFGTLEIISTVETEKGEIQWSTPTEHRKSTSEEANETAKEGPATAPTGDKKEKGKVNSPQRGQHWDWEQLSEVFGL